MANKEHKTVSVRKFIGEMETGRRAVKRALAELNISLPEGISSYNKAEIMDADTQQKVIQHLKLAHPKDVDHYYEEGHMTTKDLVEKLELSKSAVERYLDALYPGWAKNYPRIVNENKKRAVLLPPEVVNNIERYHLLLRARRVLHIWKSKNAEGKLQIYSDEKLEETISTNADFFFRLFKERDPNAILACEKLPSLFPDIKPSGAKKYRLMKKTATWAMLSRKISKDADIIDLDEKDNALFSDFEYAQSLIVAKLALHHAPIVVRVANENLKTEWGLLKQDMIIKEGFIFLLDNITPTLLKAESLGDQAVLLYDSLSKYINDLKLKRKDVLPLWINI